MKAKPFDRVVVEHGPMVLRVCRAVLGPVDAEDAWSETFLSALRAYPDLDDDTNVEAWLVTIAHRRAVDIVRVGARAPVPAADLPDRVSTTGNPGASDHDLWTALAALPDKQRLAVAYHHIGGLPHVDVARLLGNSTDAARRACADGLKTLRALYPKEPL